MPEGSLLCGEFTLEANEQMLATIVKTSPTQDFSIRCWFSKEPGGSSLDPLNEMVGHWHPNRYALYSICIHTAATYQPHQNMTTFSLKTEPGTYYLNVLNMVNEPNQYAATFVTTTVNPT